jgi:hypothetical protein
MRIQERPHFQPVVARAASSTRSDAPVDKLDKSKAVALPYWKGDIVPGMKPNLIRGTGHITRMSAIFDVSLGTVGLAAGAWGIYSGVQYLREGQKVEGVSELIGGGAAVAESYLALTGGGPHIPTLGGVGAIADGLKDVYVSWKQPNSERSKLGVAKILSGGLMIAGGATANPWLATGGALLYTGAVVVDNRKEIKELGQRVGQYAERIFNP